MKINNSSNKLADSDISEFEEKFKIKLPHDYRNFLLEHNGGRPEEDWGFDFYDISLERYDSSLVNVFLAHSPDSGEQYKDLVRGYQIAVEQEVIPPGLLPFAYDPGGNLICISVADEDYGEVCFGNHELHDPETGYIVMSPIAGSFTEFLEKLYVCDDTLMP